MTPRSFWMILIRIMGLWFILKSVQPLYQFISLFFIRDGNPDTQTLLTMGLFSTVVLGLFLLILFLVLFRTEWIIDLLKLDKGFCEEQLEISLHHSSILQIAIIVIGGILFLKNLPTLIMQVLGNFEHLVRLDYGYYPTRWSPVLYTFLNLLLGYLLMTNSRWLVRIIEKTRRKNRTEL